MIQKAKEIQGHADRNEMKNVFKAIKAIYDPCIKGTAPLLSSQNRRYKDTLKKFLKQLQINPATWEDLIQDRPAWKISAKTGSAIYEATRIAAAKAKRAARNSPVPRTNNVNAQALPACPRCQRTFHTRISLWDIFERNAPTI
ncbi:unnamed protein product [Schistocephalus solidus]|uniref:Zinc finger, CCHC-type n=1 Tax=Schistocephalus solidus TaxID=70667 RepID=A0A183SST3_SCHSO|nr:unnamed protein product [Schistocephalus solidus]